MTNPLQPGWTSRTGGIKPEYLRKAIREKDSAWKEYQDYIDSGEDNDDYDVDYARDLLNSAINADYDEAVLYDKWQKELAN